MKNLSNELEEKYFLPAGVASLFPCKGEKNNPRPPIFGTDEHCSKDISEFKGVKWGRDHPLMEASNRNCIDVLEHRLTT